MLLNHGLVATIQPCKRFLIEYVYGYEASNYNIEHEKHIVDLKLNFIGVLDKGPDWGFFHGVEQYTSYDSIFSLPFFFCFDELNCIKLAITFKKKVTNDSCSFSLLYRKYEKKSLYYGGSAVSHFSSRDRRIGDRSRQMMMSVLYFTTMRKAHNE